MIESTLKNRTLLYNQLFPSQLGTLIRCKKSAIVYASKGFSYNYSDQLLDIAVRSEIY